MKEIIKNFKEKFKTEELKIYETEYWLWSLRPHQSTLGASILSLKRECPTLGNVKVEEFEDLKKMINVIEDTMKETFNYDIMNYLMLMMVDKQVHYHVIPRYERESEFDGDIWKDSCWPSLPNLSGEELELNKIKKLSAYIKECLKINNN